MSVGSSTLNFRFEARDDTTLYLSSPIGNIEIPNDKDQERSDSKDASSPCMFSKFMILRVRNEFAGSVKNQLFEVLCQIIEKSMPQLDRVLENIAPQSAENYQVVVDHFAMMGLSMIPKIIPNTNVNIEVLYTQKEQNIPSDAEDTTIKLEIDKYNNIYLISPFIEKISPYGSEIGDDGINKYFKCMELKVLEKDSSDVVNQLDYVVRKIINRNLIMWMNPARDSDTVEIQFSKEDKTQTKEVKISDEYTYPKKGNRYLDKLNGWRNSGVKQKPRQERKEKRNPLDDGVKIPTASIPRRANTH